MRSTTLFKKLTPSVVNAIIVVGATAPLLSVVPYTTWRLIPILAFFFYSLAVYRFNQGRCVGMMLCSTQWSRHGGLQHGSLFGVLYTLSFATLFFWIWFPLDLFLINVLLIQLPCVLLTGTTLHGYLTGNTSVVS